MHSAAPGPARSTPARVPRVSRGEWTAPAVRRSVARLRGTPCAVPRRPRAVPCLPTRTTWAYGHRRVATTPPPTRGRRRAAHQSVRDRSPPRGGRRARRAGGVRGRPRRAGQPPGLPGARRLARRGPAVGPADGRRREHARPVAGQRLRGAVPRRAPRRPGLPHGADRTAATRTARRTAPRTGGTTATDARDCSSSTSRAPGSRASPGRVSRRRPCWPTATSSTRRSRSSRERNGDASSRNDVEVVSLTVGGNDLFSPGLRRVRGEPVPGDHVRPGAGGHVRRLRGAVRADPRRRCEPPADPASSSSRRRTTTRSRSATRAPGRSGSPGPPWWATPSSRAGPCRASG